MADYNLDNSIVLVGYIKEEDIRFPKVLTENDKSKENLFLIGKLTPLDPTKEKVSIKGTFYGYPSGPVRLFTKEETHPDYPSTFNVLKYEIFIPKNEDDVKRYLEEHFKLSSVQAQKLFKKLGSEVLDVLNEDLAREIAYDKEVKLFLSDSRREEFIQKSKEHRLDQDVRMFFYDYQFTDGQVKKVIEHYKDLKIDPVKDIKNDPYKLLKVSGIGFQTADKLYLNLGNPPDSEMRIMSSLLYIITEYCKSTGDLYIDESELYGTLRRVLGLSSPNYDFGYERFLEIIDKRDLNSKSYEKSERFIDLRCLILSSSQRGKYKAVFLEEYYQWEVFVSEIISLSLDSKVNKIELDESDYDFGEKVLNEDQKKGVRSLFENKISIVSGYGGTGKSTIIKKIIDKCKKENLTYKLLAPTGKAVDVLASMTNESKNCSTIHRHLKLAQEGETPENIIGEDVIIVDESSMMSLPLFNSLLKGFSKLVTDEKKRLLLVGDDNQLSPIGLGNPYKSLIQYSESYGIPVTQLTQIYRQKEGSLVLENSKKVVQFLEDPQNNILNLTPNNGIDWETYSTMGQSSQMIKNSILEVVKSKGWNSEEDVILTAKYKGDCGIIELNKEIQLYLNKDKSYFLKAGYNTFYLEDRVMHITQNWYRGSGHGDGEEELNVLPLDILDKSENIQKLSEVYQEVLGEKKYLSSPFSDLITYSKRDRKFLCDGIVVGEYTTDGKVELNDFKEYRKVLISRDETKYPDWFTNYDSSVYNGNWGRVVALKIRESTPLEKKWIGIVNGVTKELGSFSNIKDYVVIIDFGDKLVPYSYENLVDMTTLFYASSVHKAQGSQFKNLYAVTQSSDLFMIDRHWLYTMLSRAQEKVYYFGNQELTQRIQNKNNLEKRKSLFPHYLKHLRLLSEKMKSEKSEDEFNKFLYEKSITLTKNHHLVEDNSEKEIEITKSGVSKSTGVTSSKSNLSGNKKD